MVFKKLNSSLFTPFFFFNPNEGFLTQGSVVPQEALDLNISAARRSGTRREWSNSDTILIHTTQLNSKRPPFGDKNL